MQSIKLSPTATLALLGLQGGKDASFLLLSQEGELRRPGAAQVATWAEAVRAALDHSLIIVNVRKGSVSRPLPTAHRSALMPQIVALAGFLHGPTYKPVAWAYDIIMLPDNPTWE